MRNEAAVWDRFAGRYDTLMKSDRYAYHIIIQKITALLTPESTVLEVATGTGILSLGIAANANQIKAIDISGKMIAQAQAKARAEGIFNIEFSVGDAYALPCDTDTFDVAIIANALHIMPQPEKALSEIRRVLKPGGYLIAPTFVHAENLKAAVFSRFASLTGFRAYHRWSQQSYSRFLEAQGWHVNHSEILSSSIPLVYCQCRPLR